MSAPYPDRQQPAWQVKSISNLAGGLNTAVPEHEIDDSECSYCENVRFKYGRVVTDTGYVHLGHSGVGSTPMRGRTRGLFTHQNAAGVNTTLAVTDLSVYRYVPALDVWHYVRSSIDTTVSANEAGGATVIDVADTTGFAINDFIGIDLDNGAQHQTHVIAVGAGAPGTLTINAALPSAASIGRIVIRAVVLTGNADNQVVWAAVPSHEWTVFTNGVDPPMRFDGTDCRVIPNLPSGGTLVCKTLAVFRDAYLLLFNLIEGGTLRPYKMVWCSAGDPTNWSTGDSGDNSLLDSRDSIVAARALVGEMIIYRSASIVIMEYVGLPFRTFRWTPVNFGRTITTEGVGCVAPNAVFAFTDLHIVLGRNRIYVYRGGDITDTISSKIFSIFFGPTGLFSRERLNRAFMFYEDVNDELYIGSPNGSANGSSYFAVLDVETGKWRIRKTNHPMLCAGTRPLTAAEAARIIDLIGTIAQQTWTIGGGGVSVGGTIVMLGQEAGAATSGFVVEYDLISTTDQGAIIPWQIVTKAFRAFDRFVRCDWVEIETAGNRVNVRRYNTPVGGLEHLFLTPTTGYKTRTRVAKQFIHETLKFRLDNTTAGVEIGVFSFRFRPESRWAM